MKVKHFVWIGERPPDEDVIRHTLETNGWAVHPWRDPSDRAYAPHTHEEDENVWMIAGEMDVTIAERVYHLAPGDRLLLPAKIVRSARVGPGGASYLIGRRWVEPAARVKR